MSIDRRSTSPIRYRSIRPAVKSTVARDLIFLVSWKFDPPRYFYIPPPPSVFFREHKGSVFTVNRVATETFDSFFFLGIKRPGSHMSSAYLFIYQRLTRLIRGARYTEENPLTIYHRHLYILAFPLDPSILPRSDLDHGGIFNRVTISSQQWRIAAIEPRPGKTTVRVPYKTFGNRSKNSDRQIKRNRSRSNE